MRQRTVPCIKINDLNKYYGAKHVLKGLSFDVKSNDRLGLLGVNGAGKTTLFKILSGHEQYESGSVFISRKGRIGILDQIPEYSEEFTVSDVLQSAFDQVYELKSKITELENEMLSKSSEIIIRKYSAILNEYEIHGGYELDYRLAKVCIGLNIDEEFRKKPFRVLSGGEKTRVNLARIILMNTDILLLDEPTNHLDIKSMEWLEEYLEEYQGCVVAISHDRYFLDRAIKRIVEIIDGKSEFFEGNYSYYVKEKEARRAAQLEIFEQQQKKIKQLEEASKRMHDWAGRADNPTLHKQAFAIEKRIERMQKIDKPKSDKAMQSDFQIKNFSGSEIIKIRNAQKEFGTKKIFNCLDFDVYNGERVALIGENGCGKTTLIQVITGGTKLEKGEVKIGESIRYAYLPQIVEFENTDWTIVQTIRDALECSELHARNLLAGYKFSGDDVFKTINVLSGGEKSRLKLCLIMQQQVNLLILDEPTNHLDISSKEWIEEAVDKFSGTILFVSHDRYFINRFATRITELKNGHITDFYGNYDQFREWEKTKENSADTEMKTKGKKNTRPVRQKRVKSPEELRDELEIKIFEAESAMLSIEQEMEQNQSDYIYLETLCTKKEELMGIIEKLYENYE
jgi:ATP-binding cassette, subfamily F, member 3